MMSTPINPDPAAASHATEASAAEGSPGAMIREARSRLRMSVEDLAAATKLARQTLEALERDDFNALQEAVYVRGYYRKCAKILGLNEVRLVEAYQGRVAPKRPDPPTKLRLASGTDIGAANPLPVPMAVASAVGAVIVGILLWNLFKSPDMPHGQSVAEEPIQVEAPSTQPVPLEPGAEGVPAPALNPAAPAGDATVPTVSPPDSPALPAAAASATARPLTLSFSNTSWARVEDASGKVLVNGLMRQGETQSLQGQPPFSVFLGNGPGVKLEFEGKPVDFSRHVSDNLTARFRVPEAGN